MQLPIGAESDFKGVVDLIEMNALIWHDETLGAQWDVVEIPADLQGAGRGVSREADRNGRRAGRDRDGSLPRRQDARRTTRSAR